MKTIEKAKTYGLSALSNQELFALVIGENAAKVYEDYGTLYNLGTATPKELTDHAGIGESKALSIAATCEIAKRLKADYQNQCRPTIKDVTDVAELVMPDMMFEKREKVIALLLNCKGELESKELISIGGLSETNVHPREVLSPAIKKSAAGIILIHNHPSGDPTPSNEDIVATRRLIEACKIVGIKFVDHVIIGQGQYVSMKCEGIIPSS